ncbi:alpha/beta hydrolase [uncultured Enterovirga sp.]|uniref:alpha/beta hydrolase n=1 Tax=uncultured Enterovirga sp. TaxID=2026352 RepID=UPI0035CC98B3
MTGRARTLRIVTALVALAMMGSALVAIRSAEERLSVRRTKVAGTPATIYRPAGDARGPAVVVAHGFAGSQQLMQAFATTLARSGYLAITFDFPGHGRNPKPLAGSITREDGATRALVAETSRIVDLALTLGDGRLALLGHSMASDIVVRVAAARPEATATVAVSMFSPAVTPSSPRNLLVISGEWEGMLRREALRAVGLVSAPATPEEGKTYGDVASGLARRAAVSGSVEYVGVLYSQDGLREAVTWLDMSFARVRTDPPYLDRRGPWILILLAGAVLLARPLAGLLPVVAAAPAGAGLGWRRLWLPLLAPAVATPLILRLVPTNVLPVLVGDYLAAHFALYGLLTASCLLWVRRRGPSPVRIAASRAALIAAASAAIAYGFVGLVWPIDTYVTSFVAGGLRSVLVVAMLAGTLSYVLADEWLTRGRGSARGGYAASKLALLLSLALAVALDFERLFFLIIILPVILLFFVVHGLFSSWIYGRTRHPFVAGVSNAVALAWAIGVTFPLLAAGG